MAAADLLVLNHTLFFTLMASAEETLADDANFIFPRDFVILDEAHTIENIAAQAFGIHVSESSVRFELGRLYNPKTRKGFFASVGDSDAIRDVVQAIAMTETFFRNAEAVCKFTGTYAKEFRIREPGLVENELALPLQRVANFALKAGDAAKSEGQRLELHDIAKRLGGLRTNLSAFLDQTEDGHVYWAERGTGDHRSLALHSAPIDVSPKLEEIFFGGGKACVFTSATLSVGDDERLNYFRNRVGGQKAQSACIHSPFDFKKQMRLYLVKRMPEPKDEAYGDAMQDKISHFLGLSQGRAFVLFTSYTQMTAMADRLEDFCLDNGWRLLVQGRGMPRHQLLAEFKKDVHSILFGTDSFWTGVDVPGEALSNVIITRLPFAVPDHPLTASRMEHLEEQGINSFSEYSVPEAILKLRQGVGRLIRTQKDQGMVVILDNRILSKPYGRAFLASLPDCPTEIVA